MQAPENSKILSNVAQAFGSVLSSVLSDVCGQSWRTRIAEQIVSALPVTECVHFRFTMSGGLEGEVILSVRTAELPALRLNPAASSEESAKLIEAALVSATTVWAQAFSEYGEVEVEVQVAPDSGSMKEPVIELVGTGDGSTVQTSLFLAFSPRFISSVQNIAAKALSYPAAIPSANLDLVMDVELNVTLRFGQRQLSLREVLDLTSGSVVELDRQVDEPVELVLDGRVVARGEAVIIDGVYGMRITQVLQPLVA
jgi:flagellar motor switch protein FliN/FliY